MGTQVQTKLQAGHERCRLIAVLLASRASTDTILSGDETALLSGDWGFFPAKQRRKHRAPNKNLDATERLLYLIVGDLRQLRIEISNQFSPFFLIATRCSGVVGRNRADVCDRRESCGENAIVGAHGDCSPSPARDLCQAYCQLDTIADSPDTKLS
jgi:hypothetical protein